MNRVLAARKNGHEKKYFHIAHEEFGALKLLIGTRQQ